MRPDASLRDNALIMFSKAPVAGQVKTRLAADLGPEIAAQLQEAFIRDLGERFANFRGESIVACAPDQNHPAFAALAQKGWRCWTQGEGDLGTRLKRALEAALDRGARRVVFIGSDSPSLPMALIEQAFAALSDHEAVLGPVFDGGYYLVGARAHLKPLFTGIPWGTERVFACTVENLERARVSYSILPFWYDVDDLRTLMGLANHVGLMGPYGPIEAPMTARVLVALGGWREV